MLGKDLIPILFDGIEEEEEESVVPEGFLVKDLQSANWCVAKYAMAEERIKEAEEMKRAAIEHVNRWFERYTSDFQVTKMTMQDLLKPYIAEMIKDQKTKNMKLINGTAGFRKTPERVEVKDETQLIAFAKTNGIPVKIKESVSKTDVKTFIKKTGAIPEGVEFIEGSDKFYVKIGD